MENSVEYSEGGPRYVHVRSSSLSQLEDNVNVYMSEDLSWTPADGVQVIQRKGQPDLYLQVLCKRSDIQVVSNSFNAIGYQDSDSFVNTLRDLADSVRRM